MDKKEIKNEEKVMDEEKVDEVTEEEMDPEDVFKVKILDTVERMDEQFEILNAPLMNATPMQLLKNDIHVKNMKLLYTAPFMDAFMDIKDAMFTDEVYAIWTFSIVRELFMSMMDDLGNAYYKLAMDETIDLDDLKRDYTLVHNKLDELGDNLSTEELFYAFDDEKKYPEFLIAKDSAFEVAIKDREEALGKVEEED